MSRAELLLERLRNKGVVIRAHDSRLVVEARPGVITPRLRGELVKNKSALLSALGQEVRNGGEEIAVCEVAGLLVVAYRRLMEVRRTAADGAAASSDARLAIPVDESGHGVGQHNA